MCISILLGHLLAKYDHLSMKKYKKIEQIQKNTTVSPFFNLFLPFQNIGCRYSNSFSTFGVPSYLQYHDIIHYIVTSTACSRKLASFACILVIWVFVPISDTYIFFIRKCATDRSVLLQYH